MLSSHFTTSKMLHYRQQFSINFPIPSELSQKTWEIFQKTWEIFQKTWEIFRKTLDIFPKTWEFFSVPSEKRFLTANRNTKKAGNKGPTSLEVQLLMARIDNFQAQTHNYNIRREKKVIKMRGWKGDNRSQKKQTHLRNRLVYPRADIARKNYLNLLSKKRGWARKNTPKEKVWRRAAGSMAPFFSCKGPASVI